MAVESWKPRDSDILSWWCQEREETRKEWRNLIRDMNYVCCSISAKQTGLRALGTIARHDATIWKSLWNREHTFAFALLYAPVHASVKSGTSQGLSTGGGSNLQGTRAEPQALRRAREREPMKSRR